MGYYDSARAFTALDAGRDQLWNSLHSPTGGLSTIRAQAPLRRPLQLELQYITSGGVVDVCQPTTGIVQRPELSQMRDVKLGLF